MTASLAPADPYTTSFAADVTDVAGTDVRLAETYFYPEGGGQPADRGTIGGVAVEHVYADDDGVVHALAVVADEVGEAVALVARALLLPVTGVPAGDGVELLGLVLRGSLLPVYVGVVPVVVGLRALVVARAVRADGELRPGDVRLAQRVGGRPAELAGLTAASAARAAGRVLRHTLSYESATISIPGLRPGYH